MNRWYRVNKKRPCVICKHPDWCTYQEDVACCMRVRSEVPMRNGGYLHRLKEPICFTPIRQAIPDRRINVEGIWNLWTTSTERVDQFASSLGVDTDALIEIGCRWSGKAWAFPMKDATGKMIGIRLRSDQGDKWAVKGSKAGLFIPTSHSGISDGALYLVEGPTDLAAALTMGLRSIGRAACLGQEQMILDYVRRNHIERLVIVTDNDEPGLRGAEKLQGMLSILSCVWVPPTKDIREFLNLGGDYRTMQSCIKDLVWQKAQRAA